MKKIPVLLFNQSLPYATMEKSGSVFIVRFHGEIVGAMEIRNNEYALELICNHLDRINNYDVA